MAPVGRTPEPVLYSHSVGAATLQQDITTQQAAAVCTGEQSTPDLECSPLVPVNRLAEDCSQIMQSRTLLLCCRPPAPAGTYLGSLMTSGLTASQLACVVFPDMSKVSAVRNRTGSRSRSRPQRARSGWRGGGSCQQPAWPPRRLRARVLSSSLQVKLIQGIYSSVSSAGGHHGRPSSSVVVLLQHGARATSR